MYIQPAPEQTPRFSPTNNAPLSPFALAHSARAAAFQKSLDTTRQKAKTLWRDGYTWKVVRRLVYDVTSPEGNVYTVDAIGETCTCEMFSRAGECKHQIAVCDRVRDACAFLTFPEAETVTPPAPVKAAPVTVTRAGILREEFWGADHARPTVYRLVPAEKTDAGGKLFDTESAAREWARLANVCVKSMTRINSVW